jgi:hypothetical protein
MKTTIRVTKHSGRVEVKATNWQGVIGEYQDKLVFVGWDQLDVPTLRLLVAVRRLRGVKGFCGDNGRGGEGVYPNQIEYRYS